MGILEPILDSPRTVWATCVIMYALNYELGAFGSEMAVDFGSTAHYLFKDYQKTVSVCIHWTKNVHVLFA